MKKFLSLLTAVLLVMSIALMPVFAEGESPTGDGYELIITSQGAQGSAEYEQIKTNLDAAAANQCAPEEGYVKVMEFDASRVRKDDAEFNHGAYTIVVDASLDGKDFYVMHFAKNESWEKVNGCSYSGGKLTIPAPSLSVFAVYAKDSTSSSTTGGTTSPATGDNSVYYAVMAAVCVLLAGVFVRKAVKNN